MVLWWPSPSRKLPSCPVISSPPTLSLVLPAAPYPSLPHLPLSLLSSLPPLSAVLARGHNVTTQTASQAPWSKAPLSLSLLCRSLFCCSLFFHSLFCHYLVSLYPMLLFCLMFTLPRSLSPVSLCLSLSSSVLFCLTRSTTFPQPSHSIQLPRLLALPFPQCPFQSSFARVNHFPLLLSFIRLPISPASLAPRFYFSPLRSNTIPLHPFSPNVHYAPLSRSSPPPYLPWV